MFFWRGTARRVRATAPIMSWSACWPNGRCWNSAASPWANNWPICSSKSKPHANAWLGKRRRSRPRAVPMPANARRCKSAAPTSTLEAEVLRRRAQELANGLLPFAVAPDMLRAVRKRLAVEQTYQEQQAARQLVERQLAVLQREMDQSAFWVDGSQELQIPVRQQIYQQVAGSLRGALLDRRGRRRRGDPPRIRQGARPTRPSGSTRHWPMCPWPSAGLRSRLTSLEQEATRRRCRPGTRAGG